jgi:hypothetical protein
MKKLLIGCGLVVLLLAVAGAGITYWLYRRVSTTVSQMTEVGRAPELDRQVRNTTPFSPPADGGLSAAQVERLVSVQRGVREKLGRRFGELEQKYKTLLDKQEATALDLPQIVAAYRDLAALWSEAKRAQVDALNASGFSLEEYRWVRSQAYAALGVPIVELDVSRILEQIQNATQDVGPDDVRVKGSIGPSGPEANRPLVEPFRKTLEENAALATLGL